MWACVSELVEEWQGWAAMAAFGLGAVFLWKLRSVLPSQKQRPLGCQIWGNTSNASKSVIHCGGTPSRHISDSEWPEMVTLVTRAYMKPGPDEEVLRKLISTCAASVDADARSWPHGWLEPVDDLFWLKFLLASHFNTEKAIAVSQNYLSAHTQDCCTSSVLARHFDGKAIAPCVTRNGMLVIVLRVKYWPVGASLDALKEWFCGMLDAVIAWNMMQREKGLTPPTNKLERYIFLLDLDGAGRKHADFSSASALASFAPSRYPDFMQAAYAINASSGLVSLWSFAKRILDQRARQKYVLLGRGDKSLSHIIREEDLPRSLGGVAEEWPPAEDMTALERLGLCASLLASSDSHFTSEQLNPEGGEANETHLDLGSRPRSTWTCCG